MATTNKNYPLIKETDSTGQPLNAYDQLVTESNNFRRAVDNDINSLEQNVSLAHASNRLSFTPNSSVVSNHNVVVASNGEFLTITGDLRFTSDYVESAGVQLGSINITVIRDLPFYAYNRNRYNHKQLMINRNGNIYLRNDGRIVNGGDSLNFAAIIPIF